MPADVGQVAPRPTVGRPHSVTPTTGTPARSGPYRPHRLARAVGCVPCRRPGSPTSDGSSRSTPPTATCWTRPGPELPRGWWPWRTTRRPAGDGWAGPGRPGRGQPPGVGPAPARPSTRATATWPPRRWPWPPWTPSGRSASAGVSGSSGPTTWSTPVVGSWPASWPRRTCCRRRQSDGPPRPGRGGDRHQRQLAGGGRRPPARAARPGRLAAPAGGGPVDREALLDWHCSAALDPRAADLGHARRPGRGWPATCWPSAPRSGPGCGSTCADGSFEGTATGISPRATSSWRPDGATRTVVAGDVVHVRPGS